MRRTRLEIAAVAACLLTLLITGAVLAQTAEPAQPAVRIFYFYSPTCPHCQVVSDEVLPPLQQKYGDRLQIRRFDFDPVPNYMVMLKLEKQAGVDSGGVPEMFVGSEVLIGEDEIRANLPGLIEQYAAAGGTEWPSQDMPVASTEAPAQQSNASGFALAWVIMIGMFAALLYAGVAVARSLRGSVPRQLPEWLNLGIPVLALAGLGAALYLSYVETNSVRAICGPVGDCNAVQSSRYARLFGVPIGVLGAVGYVAILVTWLWGRLRSDFLAEYAPLALFGMTLFGVLFSVYLTYLELFVIHAVCMWCLSSAVIMTLLMLLSVSPALHTIATVEDEALGSGA